MAGTSGIALAHAIDERLALSELTALARATTRLLERAGSLI
jgi:acetylornithine deacetylase/succinyl-diaminopimelate desuccinylase-like protein